MDRVKQIEVMADDLCDCHEEFVTNTGEIYTDYDATARKMFDKGYHKQEWISVDERLPDNDYEKHWHDRQYYLVYTEPTGLMYVAKFGYKGYKWWVSNDTVLDEKNYKKVTHWMPLPEPPKGEER